MMSYPERVTAVFEAAVLREPAEREAYLREACDGDIDLQQQVEALLVDVERPALIDSPVGEAVVELLGDDSAVVIGKRLGPYRLDSLLGIGGMGEVYRATDTVLSRQVAIKLLPADVATDPERVARFRREARILASLNHPNVAAIYGVETLDGEHGSASGLVLELVEGPTLADKLSAGALPLDDALTVARQIADALDAAHQLGIIHRDLKPANIKVREDGTVKVLDFGLARVTAMDSDADASTARRSPADSPTITSPAMTAAGIILGTAAYMSPEQAKGRLADKRGDIWAFGCVLYEMLTGRRAFAGEDVSDTLAAVLRGDPDWAALPKDLPPPVGALLRGCLTKDRTRRVSDVSTLRFVLQNSDSLAPIVFGSATPRASSPLWRRLMTPVAAAIAASSAVGAIVWFATRPPEPRVTRFFVAPTGTAALALDPVGRDVAALSGGAIVYKGVVTESQSRLWVRMRERLEPTLLVSTGSPRSPFSSPDGEWVGFIDTGTVNIEIRKVAITGGPTVLISSLPGGASAGMTWGDDDNIIFGTADPTTGLVRVSSAGGTPEVLTRPDRTRGESDHVWPHYLPGSKVVLFTITSASGDNVTSQIAALDLRNGAIKILLQGSQPHYTSSGHLVYISKGTLFAVRFDADLLDVSGPSIPVTPELITLASGATEFDIARDGTLVYVPAGSQAEGPDRTLVWVDQQGREEPIKSDRSRAYEFASLSPDNTRVAVAVYSPGRDIWIVNLASGAATRATFNPGIDSAPVWLDDRQIVYTSRAFNDIPRVFRRNADATGEAEPLGQEIPNPPPMLMTSISPGGKNATSILGTTFLGPSDVMVLTLSDGRLRPLLHDAYVERNAAVSPDGRFVAYETNADGLFQIKVRPFPDVDGGQWSVSSQEGFQPAWALDGSALFYRAADGAVMRVPVRPGPTWNAGPPTKLFDGQAFLRATTTGIGRTYDVAKDGRFLMVKEPAADRTPSIPMVVVQNWLEELKRLVP